MSTHSDIPANSHAIVLTEVTDMGGAERSCLAMANWLLDQGMPSHIVTYVDRVGLEAFSHHPLTVVQLKPIMKPRQKIDALRQYFSGRPDSPKPLLSGYQPTLHATLAGVRGFHCLMHDTPSLFNYNPQRTSFKQKAGRLISNKIVSHGLKSGGATIVTSEYLKAETMREFGVKASIARMGGLSRQDAFRLRPVKNTLRMLSVSRVEANKRIDWMVRALAELEAAPTPLSAQIDWRLDVAGKGSALEPMRQLAEDRGLSQRIIFHGFVSDDDLRVLYDNAELFLMPALQGYGIPAIESLSRGIPVMLHRDSGVSDVLLNTPWATVMHGGEEEMVSALISAIHKVLNGAQLETPLPDLPTEESWAAEVAHLCRWV